VNGGNWLNRPDQIMNADPQFCLASKSDLATEMTCHPAMLVRRTGTIGRFSFVQIEMRQTQFPAITREH